MEMEHLRVVLNFLSRYWLNTTPSISESKFNFNSDISNENKEYSYYETPAPLYVLPIDEHKSSYELVKGRERKAMENGNEDTTVAVGFIPLTNQVWQSLLLLCHRSNTTSEPIYIIYEWGLSLSLRPTLEIFQTLVKQFVIARDYFSAVSIITLMNDKLKQNLFQVYFETFWKMPWTVRTDEEFEYLVESVYTSASSAYNIIQWIFEFVLEQIKPTKKRSDLQGQTYLWCLYRLMQVLNPLKAINIPDEYKEIIQSETPPLPNAIHFNLSKDASIPLIERSEFLRLRESSRIFLHRFDRQKQNHSEVDYEESDG
jgi:hypothetical protein